MNSDTKSNCLTASIISLSPLTVRDTLSNKVYHVKCNGNAFDESIADMPLNATVNLCDYFIEGNEISPLYIIYEPDYLVDASAIASCCNDYGNSQYGYLLSRIRQFSPSEAIMVGNAANMILDHLVNADNINDVSLNDIYKELFRRYPLELASITTLGKQFFVTVGEHFTRLRNVIAQLGKSSIDRKSGLIEPSYICPKLGMQGRLDFYYPQEPTGIELKSGFAPYYGDEVLESHKAQLSLYYIILHQTLKIPFDHLKFYILYSKCDTNNMRRVTPSIEYIQTLLNIRNLIVETELRIASGDNDSLANEFKHINVEEFAKTGVTPSYITRDINAANSALAKNNGNDVIIYFYRYFRFVTLEHILAKTSISDREERHCFADLWKADYDSKIKSGNIINGLSITELQSSEDTTYVTLNMPNKRSNTYNFRIGDIVVLYIANGTTNATEQQIFRASLSKINSDSIELRLRYKCPHTAFSVSDTLYAVEHDFMESSFGTYYHGLADMLTAPRHRTDVILGKTAPEYGTDFTPILKYNSNELKQIVTNALNSHDIHLLWGPPGTGKTSTALRYMVEECLHLPQHKIIIIAYTNRAVDEICAMLKKSGRRFIRIGSDLSCDVAYKDNIIGNITDKCINRTELMDTLNSYSIYTGTLASVSNKSSITKLLHFNTCFVDEASQILEHQIMGLLCCVHNQSNRPSIDRFIFIGDHLQLPAIVAQSPQRSRISDERLLNLGITDCRMSLFERLYNKYKGDNRICSMLSTQWRMHPEIASIANALFYGNKLKNGTAPHQCASKLYSNIVATDTELFNYRVLYIASQAEYNKSAKFNTCEASSIANIIKIISTESNSKLPIYKRVGIITPYRNQIALIRSKISQLEGIEGSEHIVIDTVERYQGSQFEIIIYSTSVNSENQMQLLSPDNETDRKLNVAITRAQRQLIILGVENIICTSPSYNAIVTKYAHHCIL